MRWAITTTKATPPVILTIISIDILIIFWWTFPIDIASGTFSFIINISWIFLLLTCFFYLWLFFLSKIFFSADSFEVEIIFKSDYWLYLEFQVHVDITITKEELLLTKNNYVVHKCRGICAVKNSLVILEAVAKLALCDDLNFLYRKQLIFILNYIKIDVII